MSEGKFWSIIAAGLFVTAIAAAGLLCAGCATSDTDGGIQTPFFNVRSKTSTPSPADIGSRLRIENLDATGLAADLIAALVGRATVDLAEIKGASTEDLVRELERRILAEAEAEAEAEPAEEAPAPAE